MIGRHRRSPISRGGRRGARQEIVPHRKHRRVTVAPRKSRSGDDPPVAKPAQYTKSVGRALAILKTFDAKQRLLSLSDISGRLGYDKASVWRLLLTMQQHGFIDQDPVTRRYSLGWAILELGASVPVRMDLRDIVRPVMTQLAAETGLTVFFAVLANHRALCAERVDGSSSFMLRVWPPGTTLPLHCGAAPRILLAHLPDDEISAVLARPLEPLTPRSQTSKRVLWQEIRAIRRRGWALSVDDVAVGGAALGMPVRDAADRVVGAISVSALRHEIVGARRHLRRCLDGVVHALERRLRR